MLELKLILLACIVLTSSGIGFLYAKKYRERLKELKDSRLAMTILETKMKLTKEPMAHIFETVARQAQTRNISLLFRTSSRPYGIHHCEQCLE